MEKVSVQKPKRPFGDTRRTVVLREFGLLKKPYYGKGSKERRERRERWEREGEMERRGGKGSLSLSCSLSHTHTHPAVVSSDEGESQMFVYISSQLPV